MTGFSDTLEPGWQRERMDNFQAIMLGRTVEEDQVDDGWTHHYAVVNNPPRKKGMSLAEYIENAEAIDFRIMDEHRRRVEELVEDPETAEILKPYYRYICKRPCFHDEYLSAYNNPNVSADRLPGRLRTHHRARAGRGRSGSTRSTPSSTAPASSPSARRSTAGPVTTSWAGTASPWPRSGPMGRPASSA